MVLFIGLGFFLLMCHTYAQGRSRLGGSTDPKNPARPESTHEIRGNPVSNALGMGRWLRECPVEMMFVSFAERHTMPKWTIILNESHEVTNRKYGRLGVHCVYAKTAFLRFTNLKFKFFFFSAWPQTPRRCAPELRWGTSVPNTP